MCSLTAHVDRDLKLYHWMKLTREFEDRVSRLHAQNRILGGVYSGRGQEAVAVGCCADLELEDVIFPLHRDLGALLVKGVDPGRLMAQLLGKETGLSRGKDSFLHGGDPAHGVFGGTSMLGATLPVACGVALAMKLRRDPHVAVAFFGEGASSRGDVHEAMNFAAVQALPVVFVCENNRYAYSTPQSLQMAVEDVADRAPGYGMKGMVSGGNDLGAVVETMARAVRRAREGLGPTLVELKTYRYRGHSEHDPARYRAEDELIQWTSRDPIPRWELYLELRGHDVARLRQETEAEVARIVDDALAFAEASPDPEPQEALEDLYATPLDVAPAAQPAGAEAPAAYPP